MRSLLASRRRRGRPKFAAARWLLLVLLTAAGLARAAAPEWSAYELAVLRSMSIDALRPLPAAPSNAVADDPAAARLGKRLFFDPRLSGDGSVACATCHQRERYLTDGLAQARGMGATARNTPTLVGAAWFDWLYWDGRRDSLWSQALTPFEAAAEMGSSRVAVLRLVMSDPRYRAQYARLFGRLQLSLPSAEHAGPFGVAPVRRAWDRLSDEQRAAINTAFANLGKSLAAFERTLVPPRTPFDRYVAALTGAAGASPADLDALTPAQLAGARLFISDERTRCVRCHNGPLLSNGGFHNIGSGNFGPDHLDFGRALGVPAVLRDEFNCLGPYSDAQAEQCSALRFLASHSHQPLEGAYRVPGLRGLAYTAPFFHDGSKASLEDVLAYYADPPSAAAHELEPLQLEPIEMAQLADFLRSLSAPLAAP